MNLRRFLGAFVLYAIAIGVIEALFVFIGVLSNDVVPGSFNAAFLAPSVINSMVFGVIALRILAVCLGFYVSLRVYGLPFLQISESNFKRFVEGVVVLSAANAVIFLPIINSLVIAAAFNLVINMMLFYFAIGVYGAIGEEGPSMPIRRRSG